VFGEDGDGASPRRTGALQSTRKISSVAEKLGSHEPLTDNSSLQVTL